MTSWTLQQIAELVAGDRMGPADLAIHSMERIDAATTGQLTFIGDEKYARLWPQSRASAALINRGIPLQPEDGRGLIFVDNVDLAVAKVLEAMAPALPSPAPGIHPSAIIDRNAAVDPTAIVGPLCVVGPGASIGPRTVLQASVTVMADSHIGSDGMIWPGVVIRERCRIGDRAILHPNVTVGSDGFGYRPAPGGRGIVKIPQIGSVLIGHDVEIGSGTCIDRGKFSATVIGDGTKIDNLCQIAHNCLIGRCVIIAGTTALGGSVTVGDGTMIGGGTHVRDHVTIGPGAKLFGSAAVMNDVPAGQTWGGYPARDARLALKEQVALTKLPDLIKQLRTTR
jgi:UDP-3-O-[3-hydroxymyristoyl] glucosamine N-acyltransferase